LLVDERRAKDLGQKRAFHIDASRVAQLPLPVEYFPELKGGVLPVRRRDVDLVGRVEDSLRMLIAAGFPITPIDGVSGDRSG
jgi:hypothetical protein